MNLPLDGVDPCALLTMAQRADLNVGDSSPDTDAFGTSCTWTDLIKHPGNAWGGGVSPHGSVSGVTSAEPGVQTVDGFSAVSSTALTSDLSVSCQLFVDVAPGQLLTAMFVDDSVKPSVGMSHQVACEKARKLAGDMISTLRAQQGK
jgi:hypothetical protein